jgi:uncharacterized radical SAM superfamily protein
MKSFNNKTIKSDDIRVRILYDDTSIALERKINYWLEDNSVEIISMDYTSDNNSIRVFILYKK